MEQTFVKVYRASAGSGKTYTLAAEYIAHLIGGKHWAVEEKRHRRILAITFTNKATGEMKERILAFLKKLSRREDEKLAAKIAELGDVGLEEIPERAWLALTSIVHDYENFHIRTIDTFFQRMLSSLAHELGQSAAFRVDIDDEEVTEQAVDLLLARLDDDKDLRHWVHQYVRQRVGEAKNWRLADDIKQFAKKNVLSDVFQSSETQLRKLTSDSRRMEEIRRRMRALRAAAEEELRSFWAERERLAAEIERVGVEKFQRGGGLALSFLDRISTLTKLDDPSDSVVKYAQDPSTLLKKAAQGDSEAERVAQEVASVLAAAKEKLKLATYVINSCDLILRNWNPLRLLTEISRLITALNNDNGRLLLAQTKLLFREMVSESDAPFIFEKAGTRYRNILIDEFQDTARTQWENLRKLLLDKAAGGEDCLIVGDVKQSIYRWNGGDWRILRNIDAELGQKVEQPSLNDNFRSQASIVTFNNALFPAAASLIGATEIYQDSAQHYQAKNLRGYVRLTIDRTKEETYAPLPVPTEEGQLPEHSLAAQMWQLHREGEPWNEMAILVRKKSETQLLLEHFSAHYPDIPLISDEAFYLSGSPSVMLLVSVLRYLLKPEDEVSLTYALRVYRNIALGESLSAEELVARGRDLLPAGFEDMRGTLLAMPLYELCIKLAELFSLDALCCREGMESQAAFLTSFLDEVVNFLADGGSSLQSFLDFWEERLVKTAIPSSETEGVRIMTIHKSKGLDFHSVFVPFCNWDLEDQQNASRNIEWWRPEDEEFEGLPLVPVTPISKAANSTFAHQYAEELFQRRVDNLNLAYVAFTRPQENLYIWASAKPSKKKTLTTIGDLLNESAKTFVETLQSERLEKTELPEIILRKDDAELFLLETGVPTPSRSSAAEDQKLTLRFAPRHSRATFVQSSNAEVYVTPSAQEEQDNISHGILYHRIFESIGTAREIDTALRRLFAAGIIPHTFSIDDLAAYAHERIDGADALPEVRSWFDGTRRLHREATILQRDTHGELRTMRPDRVMEREGETVVVDYKFARPLGEHEEQVRRYMRTLAAMGHQRVSGYLWYVDRNVLQRVAF